MNYHELKIKVPPPLREDLIRALYEKGCMGFIEEEDVLTAYFPDTFDIREATAELELLQRVFDHAGLKQRLLFSQAIIPGQDWNEAWKKGFTPLDIGDRFTILPPWEKKPVNRISLIIDPGMAFGTGHHETTRSCLLLMERHSPTIAKERFLDLGTGTGLLAIAASHLGFLHIMAVDTDPLAIEAARTNIMLNRISDIELREGSIEAAPGLFNCIAANIVSGVLIQFAPLIAGRLNSPGIAVFSGILAGQEDEVVAEATRCGLKLLETYPDGKWISLVLRR